MDIVAATYPAVWGIGQLVIGGLTFLSGLLVGLVMRETLPGKG